MILDGFGIREEQTANAIELSGMPFYHQMLRDFSHTSLEASHHFVGLPDGQMGTSEVGHLNMGAGRVYKQEIVRINDAIQDGSFFTNTVFSEALRHAEANKKSLHIFGLLSDGGIHASMDHLFALLELCKKTTVPVFIHAFLDGRDAPPKSALKYLEMLEEHLKEAPNVRLSTMSGRYYAMDRDNRWERIEKAYRVLTGENTTTRYATHAEAINDQYAKGVTDEFVEPCVIGEGVPEQFAQDGDAVIFYNFRVDRPRELTRSFTDDSFSHFERKQLKDLFFVTMVSYDETIQNVHVAFAKSSLKNTLAEWLSAQHKTQFHVAETEKYAHVTHFFNGGIEKPFPGETRKLVPSPKVATYDLLPAMSAPMVKDAVLEALASGEYDFLVVNFANPDMVGHTGDLPAVIDALKVIDTCLKEIVEYMLEHDMKGILTSDHGNCEQMAYEDGSPYTAHTTNVVPFIVIDKDKHTLLTQGALCDVAPTVLALMGLEQPEEMTGKSMIV